MCCGSCIWLLHGTDGTCEAPWEQAGLLKQAVPTTPPTFGRQSAMCQPYSWEDNERRISACRKSLPSHLKEGPEMGLLLQTQ